MHNQDCLKCNYKQFNHILASSFRPMFSTKDKHKFKGVYFSVNRKCTLSEHKPFSKG